MSQEERDLDALVLVVSKVFRVMPAHVADGVSMGRAVVEARHACWWFQKRMLGVRPRQIAYLWGVMGHVTVLKGIDDAETRLRDLEFLELMHRCYTGLQGQGVLTKGTPGRERV